MSTTRPKTPEDYAELLLRLRSRDLPFICANPDIVVERGDRLVWCAGALARDYAQLGGRTEIAGKPHRPIYDAALRPPATCWGAQSDAAEVLAIGDGVLTDVKGAAHVRHRRALRLRRHPLREYGDTARPDRSGSPPSSTNTAIVRSPSSRGFA